MCIKASLKKGPEMDLGALLELVPRAITGFRPLHLIWNWSPEIFVTVAVESSSLFTWQIICQTVCTNTYGMSNRTCFVLLFGCIIQHLSLHIIAILDGIQPISLIFIYDYTNNTFVYIKNFICKIKLK